MLGIAFGDEWFLLGSLDRNLGQVLGTILEIMFVCDSVGV